jgi:hypothetical protein
MNETALMWDDSCTLDYSASWRSFIPCPYSSSELLLPMSTSSLRVNDYYGATRQMLIACIGVVTTEICWK